MYVARPDRDGLACKYTYLTYKHMRTYKCIFWFESDFLQTNEKIKYKIKNILHYCYQMFCLSRLSCDDRLQQNNI